MWIASIILFGGDYDIFIWCSCDVMKFIKASEINQFRPGTFYLDVITSSNRSKDPEIKKGVNFHGKSDHNDNRPFC